MLSYLTNLILSFLLLATISKSQSTTSSTSTTTVAPVTSTTSTSTSSTTASTTSTTGSTTSTTASTTASTTHASNATNGSSVSTITLIKNNATSNYLLWPFASINENYTLPFAIDQCSSYNINGNYYLKPMCVSNKQVNVTFYNSSGCTSKAQHFELISNMSVFSCNASNNFAELAMSPNTTCPGKFKTYVGINNCFPTEYGYASFLCSGNNVQYVSFNSSSCVYNGLLAISQVNSTLCGPLFNDSIYTSLSECINNVTTPSTTSTSSTSTTSKTNSSTTSTTKASTTSTTGKVTTSSTTSGSSSTSTTQSSTRTSSGSRVFILNNVVYFLSIITIFNIIS